MGIRKKAGALDIDDDKDGSGGFVGMSNVYDGVGKGGTGWVNRWNGQWRWLVCLDHVCSKYQIYCFYIHNNLPPIKNYWSISKTIWNYVKLLENMWNYMATMSNYGSTSAIYIYEPCLQYLH